MRYFVVLIGLLGVVCHGQAADLITVYQTALEKDPQLLKAKANQTAIEENKSVARGALLPQLNAEASLSKDNTDFIEPSRPSTDGDFTNYSASVSQVLFNYPAFVSVKQAGLAYRQAQAQLNAAEQELVLRVSTRYFSVLAALDSLEFAKAEKSAVARQLEQVKKRFDVGLIAITDVQESQARFDLTVAQEIEAEYRLLVSHEEMREVTGKMFEVLVPLADNLPLIPPDPATADLWVELALKNNAVIRQTHLGMDIAHSEVNKNRGNHLPTLSAVGQYSHSERNFVGSINETDNNSLALQLNLPLFSGGQTQARVRAAQQRFVSAQEDLEEQTRRVVRETRAAFLNVLLEISRVKALKQALLSTQTALTATQAGFDVGTRTSVDILNAQQELFRARRNYARARYDYILNILRLKQAAGIIQTKDLTEINQWLKISDKSK